MQQQFDVNSQRTSMDMDSPAGNAVLRTFVIVAVLFLLFFALLAGVERAYSENTEAVEKEFLAGYALEQEIYSNISNR